VFLSNFEKFEHFGGDFIDFEAISIFLGVFEQILCKKSRRSQRKKKT
jgi:hypothetical protein